MASIHEYNNLPHEKRREYMANLSPSDLDSLLAQMSQAEVKASASKEVHTSKRQAGSGWTKNQITLMSIAILLFPPAGIIFFAVSQLMDDNRREQGFSILKNTVIYMAILAFLFPLGFLVLLGL